MTRGVAGCLLFLTALLAFAVRSLGLETVFPGDGSVVFALGDAFYHARRALFSFDHFPQVLLRDPYLNYPQGAFVPWPPLYDLALAGTARLFGSSQTVFERVAAWAPVALGALTTLPVYAAARRVASRACAVGSAVLFALFPATVQYSNVGNADHHAAQALLGALVFALVLAIVSEAPRDVRRVSRHFAALALARAALLLTWQGSLIYLGLTEGCLLLAGVITGRQDLLAGEAGSTLASAAIVLPVVLVSGTAVGGPFSAVELSRLHVVVLVAVAAVALGVRTLEHLRPSRSAVRRMLRAAALGIPALVLLLATTGAVRELGLGFGYVSKTDAYGGRNLEEYPLFSFQPRFSDRFARQCLGFFAWLIPVAPLAALLAARRRTLRAPALVLAAWAAALGALGLLQVRFANDYSPAGSVAFALMLGGAANALARRAHPRAAAALAVTLALLLLAPVLKLHWRNALRTGQALRYGIPGGDPALLTYQGSMVRFAERVRTATPETAGFDDPSVQPEYAILAYPGIGHVLHYVAHRATPADNFGPYIGLENYIAVGSFFGLRAERDAIAEAERLKARYVVTTDYGGPVPWTLVNRLHRSDGSELGGEPAFGRFRLVTEGPSGGLAIGEQFSRGVRSQGAPYKLFEIVPGAELEVHAAPGTSVSAEVLLSTPLPRQFTWRTTALAGDDGVVRLRVPYSTQTGLPTRAVQPYRVTVGGVAHAVSVPEEAVATGKTVEVGEAVP
ncbi:MAG TPA: STT3 domain-containing protein [Myxococcota bacterium]|nr:STT3 domain-containing protein [Myxococcota bacterium]